MAPTRGVGLIFSSSFPSSKAIKFSRSNSAFTSIHDVICGSSIQRRCRSYAASESSKPHRYSKRVSKDERRAMVESYVHK
ncbi:hypothetical protein GIB67_003601 [Kingdonia uniflora]|uniref:Uncharacterized protein n=1 Tax=Kingdonia uniflora TaxID=39325 RepID=A0A7J7MEW5_9MAGN|nr:hypothetical protein GIB67_003601 [Kingdonia uniflora]